jgi:hypothetical protein
LSRSVTVAAVRRGDVMNLVNAIVAEVSRRWREHNRLGATAPVTARDLPEDVDAFLRRTL